MSLLSLLSDQPLVFFVTIIIFILALSIHEFSHAYAGYLMGDTTAERQGRLTLNPLAHIDPLGFIALLTIGFGWAKPVPYNPYNLRYAHWGPLLVALAGPGSNLLMGIVSALLVPIFASSLGSQNLLVFFLLHFSYLNFGLMLFNLIPVPPLDGSQILLFALSDYRYRAIRERIERQGPMLMMGLVILTMFLGLPIFNWISRGATGLLSFFSSWY